MSELPHPETKPLWKRPSMAAAALCGDEAVVLQALRWGLRCGETRKAQIERARRDYEGASFLAWCELRDGLEDAMAAIVRDVLEWRAHGCPRAWKQVGPFCYCVALLQQSR